MSASDDATSRLSQEILLHNIDLDIRVDWNESLGTGHSGHVRPAVCRETGKELAVKVIPDSKQGRMEVVTQMEMAEKSSKVVNIYRVYLNTLQSVPHLFVAMERAGQDCYAWLEAHNPVYEMDCKRIVRQVAIGLRNLHLSGIVHQDIKLENILIDNHDNVRLGDFEFAGEVGKQLKGINTTHAYAPPELVRAQHHARLFGRSPPPLATATDMWALGVTTFVLLTREYPFGSADSIREKNRLLAGKISFKPTKWADFSLHAQRVVKSLLEPDSSKRMTVEELLVDPWLTDAF